MANIPMGIPWARGFLRAAFVGGGLHGPWQVDARTTITAKLGVKE